MTIGNNPCEANGRLVKSFFSEYARMSIQEFLDHIAHKAGLTVCPACHATFAFPSKREALIPEMLPDSAFLSEHVCRA